MNTSLRPLKRTTIAALAVSAALLSGCHDQPSTAPAASQATTQFDNQGELIERGAYLARAGDCMACHSMPGQPAYSGGLPIAASFGTIYSTNITPDPSTGIGRYNEQQFADAVRKGIRGDGRQLYPAMPYPDYAKISDADIHALYVYFMKDVQPSSVQPPRTDLMFPFNLRFGMKLWNLAFTRDAPFAAPPGANAEIARGAYLVEGLGHCGSCHTPRGLALNEKALDSRAPEFLAGGDLNGWNVPSLRGLPRWSREDIVDYLGSGRNRIAAVAGEMTDVVYNSTSHLTDTDLQAIAAYLKSLPDSRERAHADSNTVQATIARLTAARDLDEGERLYLDNCNACHFVTGKGAARVFPHLDGASVVTADNPGGLIQVILAGASTPSTARAPSVLPMPGFGERLNDQEVAELASFLRTAWSNRATKVAPSQVAKVRKSLHRR